MGRALSARPIPLFIWDDTAAPKQPADGDVSIPNTSPGRRRLASGTPSPMQAGAVIAPLAVAGTRHFGFLPARPFHNLS